MLNEFKSFIARGNVMDLAVGVIIGGAFSGIVKSLVDDIIMPVVGAVFGASISRTISSAFRVQSMRRHWQPRAQGAVFAYGNFITVLINFLILAWIIFMMVKGVNALRRQVERKEETTTAAAPPPADVALLTEIRDLLASRTAV